MRFFSSALFSHALIYICAFFPVGFCRMCFFPVRFFQSSGRDDTLKRRVTAKYAESDVSGAVRMQASTEGLASQGEYTLKA